MNFTLTVIIPVFNCEQFVEKAIQSVLLQSEVTEIIVINDGSTDATAMLLDKLQEQIPILKIFYHPNKSNLGRSASRNLGIQKATMNFISFLDADDFYVGNRFFNDKIILKQNKEIDGVYNAVGFHFYREVTHNEKGKFKISTLTKKVPPEELFNSIVSSKYGHLHLNGITVKRAIFDNIGLFNQSLVVAEDSDILFKMSLKCRLVSGIIDRPVALRGVHETNVFNRDDLYKIYNIKLYESIIVWSCRNRISLVNLDKALNYLWLFKFRENNSLWQDTVYWFLLFKKNNRIMFTYLAVKYFPMVRLRQKLFPFFYKQKYK